MKTKTYNSPEISVIGLEGLDIITTSDIEVGVETVPLPETGGSWEIL